MGGTANWAICDMSSTVRTRSRIEVHHAPAARSLRRGRRPNGASPQSSSVAPRDIVPILGSADRATTRIPPWPKERASASMATRRRRSTGGCAVRPAQAVIRRPSTSTRPASPSRNTPGCRSRCFRRHSCRRLPGRGPPSPRRHRRNVPCPIRRGSPSRLPIRGHFTAPMAFTLNSGPGSTWRCWTPPRGSPRPPPTDPPRPRTGDTWRLTRATAQRRGRPACRRTAPQQDPRRTSREWYGELSSPAVAGSPGVGGAPR